VKWNGQPVGGLMVMARNHSYEDDVILFSLEITEDGRSAFTDGSIECTATILALIHTKSDHTFDSYP
jgi:hypothetical protein